MVLLLHYFWRQLTLMEASYSQWVLVELQFFQPWEAQLEVLQIQTEEQMKN